MVVRTQKILCRTILESTNNKNINQKLTFQEGSSVLNPNHTTKANNTVNATSNTATPKTCRWTPVLG
jgi:hypothetical protein